MERARTRSDTAQMLISQHQNMTTNKLYTSSRGTKNKYGFLRCGVFAFLHNAML